MPEKINFDKLAGSYDSMRGGAERANRSALALIPHLVAGAVLEVGIGTGAVAEGIRDSGHDVYGVDISEPMLQEASKRLAGCLARADARALPLADGCLGNVVFSHVLHLIPDLPTAIAEAVRVLRPGGRLLALHGEPFADSDDIVDTMAPLEALKPPRADAPDTLTATLTMAGLSPRSRQTVVELERAVPPLAFVQIISTRQGPYLWEVDPQTWERVVEPVLAGLRALPEPERARPQVWRAYCSTFDKP